MLTSTRVMVAFLSLVFGAIAGAIHESPRQPAIHESGASYVLHGLARQRLPGELPRQGVALASPPENGPGDLPPFVPGRVLVKLRPGASTRGLDSGRAISELGVLSVPVPLGRELEAIRELTRDPRVAFAEPNFLVTALRTPDDPLFGFYQWNLRMIRAEAAWDIGVGGDDVTIGVLDTGVDLTNSDLAPKLLPGMNLLDPSAAPQDDNGHGSHVAGIAAAASNNGLGIAGVSWGARVLPVKLLDSFGLGTVEDLARGIIWAADNGARVLNISGGTEGFSQTLLDAVGYAYDNKGALIVAAVGNDGGFGGLNAPLYPAAFPGVIGVGATDSNDRRAEFSQRGSFVDVAAPGVTIVSAVLKGVGSVALGNDYDYRSGTSMSTPHVAGLAALLWSMSPALTNRQIARLIESTAQDLGPAGKDEFFGYGRIDAYAAARAASGGILGVLQDRVDFLYGPNPSETITKAVSLANTGGKAFDWTASISPTVAWLSVSPASGGLEALGAPQRLSITALPLGITASGVYTASVVISGTGTVQGSPLALPVSLYVAGRLEKLYFPLVVHLQVPGW